MFPPLLWPIPGHPGLLDILNLHAGAQLLLSSLHHFSASYSATTLRPCLPASLLTQSYYRTLGRMWAPLEPPVWAIPSSAKLRQSHRTPFHSWPTLPLAPWTVLSASGGGNVTMTTAPGAAGMQNTYFKKFTYPYGKWTSLVVPKSNIQTRWAERGILLKG